MIISKEFHDCIVAEERNLRGVTQVSSPIVFRIAKALVRSIELQSVVVADVFLLFQHLWVRSFVHRDIFQAAPGEVVEELPYVFITVAFRGIPVVLEIELLTEVPLVKLTVVPGR